MSQQPRLSDTLKQVEDHVIATAKRHISAGYIPGQDIGDPLIEVYHIGPKTYDTSIKSWVISYAFEQSSVERIAIGRDSPLEVTGTIKVTIAVPSLSLIHI